MQITERTTMRKNWEVGDKERSEGGREGVRKNGQKSAYEMIVAEDFWWKVFVDLLSSKHKLDYR